MLACCVSGGPAAERGLKGKVPGFWQIYGFYELDGRSSTFVRHEASRHGSYETRWRSVSLGRVGDDHGVFGLPKSSKSAAVRIEAAIRARDGAAGHRTSY